jgi:hypothetical protein
MTRLAATLLAVAAAALAVEAPRRTRPVERIEDAIVYTVNESIQFPIPPGRHRVTVQNTGGDWATIAWYAFTGELAE